MTRLAAFPRSAYNVNVELSLPNFPIVYMNDVVITIRDRRRRRNDIGKLDGIGNVKTVIVEGAAFRVKKFRDKYTVWSRGPLFSEVVISVRDTMIDDPRHLLDT